MSLVSVPAPPELYTALSVGQILAALELFIPGHAVLELFRPAAEYRRKCWPRAAVRGEGLLLEVVI